MKRSVGTCHSDVAREPGLPCWRMARPTRFRLTVGHARMRMVFSDASDGIIVAGMDDQRDRATAEKAVALFAKTEAGPLATSSIRRLKGGRRRSWPCRAESGVESARLSQHGVDAFGRIMAGDIGHAGAAQTLIFGVIPAYRLDSRDELFRLVND
jgi:hypothetical protein